MSSILRIIFVFCISGVAQTAYPINKCTDSSGKVSFQDAPCKADQKKESIDVSKDRDSDSLDNVYKVEANLPDIGTLVFLSYKWWDARVKEGGSGLPTTVKIKSKSGEQPLSFSMTFIPNKQNMQFSDERTAEIVEGMASRYVYGSAEQEIVLSSIDTTIGNAIYASLNEAKYLNRPVPEGEYSSITVGQISHEKVIVAFTILTNGTNSRSLKEALQILASFAIFGK